MEFDMLKNKNKIQCTHFKGYQYFQIQKFLTLAVLFLTLTPVSVFGDDLLNETFNDNSVSERGWYDSGANSAIIAIDPQRGKVLEYAYNSGASSATSGTLRHLFTASDEVSVSFYLKYQSGWSWTGLNYGPHEMYLLTNKDHSYKGPAESHLTTYIEMQNGIQEIGFQDALNIDQNQIGITLKGITENRGVFGCNGTSDTYPDGICWNDPGSKLMVRPGRST